jgi:hypothetical protein
MKESELNNKVSESLSAFDRLEPIQPSSEWQRSLSGRLESAKYKNAESNLPVRLAIALIIIFLVNIAVILNSFNNNKSRVNNRSSDLEKISKEILINPVSLSN